MFLRLFFLAFSLFLAANFSPRAQAAVIFGITNVWKYEQSNNLDGVNWKIPSYDDSEWPSGPALLYVEDHTGVTPRNTPLTLGRTTYYFRTQFNFSDTNVLSALTFSNLLDDGAVFYLNGVEVQRLRMPAAPAVITYTNFSTSGVVDATSYDVFAIYGDALTNLVVGTNVLAVEVHQVSSTSSDIVFGTALSFSNSLMTRGPYLQIGTPTSLVVRWRTAIPSNSRVRLGTNVTNLNLIADDVSVTNEHEVLVSGLSPDTKYFYAVGTSITNFAGGDTNHFFITSPLPGTPKPTRIWVIGDAGRANANQMAVRDAYYNFTGSRHTDLWLMLGDNAYDYGSDSEYQAAVFDIYPTLLRKSVLWSTLGNHETGQSTNFNGVYPYFAMFSFPTNAAAGGYPSSTEHYYSFDYGNIHFICLDSMTADRSTNGDMAIWLQNDLNSTMNNWIIAFWHHPPYTKGSHDSDTEIELIEMRQNFLPILEAGGVDLVLSGHSHSYERSYLLDQHYGTTNTLVNSMKLNSGSGRENGTGAYFKNSGTQPHQGAVYAVVGSSGGISGGLLNHPAMYISLNNLGSMVLDVAGNRLDAKFIRETGATNDFFTIIKNNITLSSAIFSGSGNFQFTVTGLIPGKTNWVQSSTNLTNWTTFRTNVASTNFLNVTNVGNTSGNRFYRVRQLP
ncbi:MAG: metallophosphoesterase family protein [Verrucomicrobiota bacterium]